MTMENNDLMIKNKGLYISVSGAQGVGKTTFCNDFRNEIEKTFHATYSVEVCGEVARKLINNGVRSDGLTQQDDYALYFKAHFNNLLAAHPSHITLFDRTFLDTISYAKLNSNLHKNWIDFSLLLGQFLIGFIDIYFFIPLDNKIALANDGVRNTNKKYQMELDKTMYQTIKGIYPNLIIISGSREERVNVAINHLKTFSITKE